MVPQDGWAAVIQVNSNIQVSSWGTDINRRPEVDEYKTLFVSTGETPPGILLYKLVMT